MAKYCVNCGAKLEVQDEFCENCGVKLEVMEAGTPKNLGRKMTTKNVFKLAGIVVLIVVILVAAVFFIPKGNTPEEVIEKTITACKDNDSNTLDGLFASEYRIYDPFVVNEVIEGMLYDFDGLENSELTFEIDGSIVVDTEETLTPLFHGLDLYYYIGLPPVHDFSDIEETVLYNVKINALQDGEAMDMEKEIILVKESGSWRLLSIE